MTGSSTTPGTEYSHSSLRYYALYLLTVGSGTIKIMGYPYVIGFSTTLVHTCDMGVTPGELIVCGKEPSIILNCVIDKRWVCDWNKFT